MNSYDYFKYLTVNLSTRKISDKNSCICTATGFYVIIKNTPVIVTAKHFANDAETTISISAHYKENERIITIPLKVKVNWIPSDEYDIAYCKVKPIAKKLKETTGKEMFYTAIPEKNIITKEELSQISILSEVLTLGYPKGISSTHHDFPLFKKGYISSLPKDIAEDGEGYLDLGAEEGYSGSPVFLNNSHLRLVGVLVKGVGEDSDTSTNTTVYVSADKILEIRENAFKN